MLGIVGFTSKITSLNDLNMKWVKATISAQIPKNSLINFSIAEGNKMNYQSEEVKVFHSASLCLSARNLRPQWANRLHNQFSKTISNAEYIAAQCDLS